MSQGKLSRVLQSLRDGSLPVLIYNRVSKTKYAPVTEATTAQVLASTFPGDGWKGFSPGARAAWVKFHRALENRSVRKVVWVGANDGKDALDLNEAFAGMDFYLLEPVRPVFERLSGNIRSQPNLRAFNVAAGAIAARKDMFVDEFSPASSLLPYASQTATDYPFLGRQSRESVQVKALDDLLVEWKLDRADLLVVDAQGYEDAVLAGARACLPGFQLVLIEMSLKQLYVGGATFDSVYQTLTRAGFQLRHITHVHKNVQNEIVQIDGLFCRD